MARNLFEMYVNFQKIGYLSNSILQYPQDANSLIYIEQRTYEYHSIEKSLHCNIVQFGFEGETPSDMKERNTQQED